ncbi:MAG: hypothetical protein ACRYGK_12400, partial [Janthinobacterium lividum]
MLTPMQAFASPVIAPSLGWLNNGADSPAFFHLHRSNAKASLAHALSLAANTTRTLDSGKNACLTNTAQYTAMPDSSKYPSTPDGRYFV